MVAGAVAVLAVASQRVSIPIVKSSAPHEVSPTMVLSHENAPEPKALAAAGPADLVLMNGVIYAGDSLRPRAEAVAIRGEQILAVGTYNEIHSWVGKGTRVIDLKGRFAMPGFNDAHVHLASAGQAKLEVTFEGVRSLADFQKRVRGRLKDFRPGEWLTGRGWDHTLWPEKRFPTGQDLDAVSRDHPMFFVRVDGHVAVANSVALQIAGISKQTQDPPDGRILRDATTGEPTGMLEEDAAMELVRLRIPKFSPSLRRRALELALEEAARFGVTSVQDNSVTDVPADDNFGWDNFLVYEELKREGKLPVRITEWLPFTTPVERLEEMRRQGGATDPWLKTGTLKGYLDGSLGSRTAALLAPYSDEPSTRGILRMDPAQVTRMSIERDKAGFQIAFHAIGDRANRVALDAFAAARAASGARDRRDRIEHAQVVAPTDFARFAELDVIASMQPCHELTDMRWSDARLGAERSKGSHAWNTMLKHGVKLAIGTDYPVEPINPMRGLYACVTRELPEGGPTGGWQPQEKISLDDCLRAYTVGSAYAQFEEGRKGQIAPGKLADIVVLSADITRVPPTELLRTEAVMTIAGGRIVYEKK